MNAAPHPFDLATRLQPLQPGRWLARTSPAYANMVGPFGGITAAVALAAVLEHPARQGEPVALTVNYAGPIADGEFEIRADPVRTNRSTQHWSLQMLQGGAVVGTATAVLATRRETWSAVDTDCPGAPDPLALPRMEPPQALRWTACYDMRFVQGELQFVPEPPAAQDSTSLLWVRDEPPRPLDFLSLASMCDVFFPRILLRRPTWVPIGTVSFTVYFHADAEMLKAVGPAPLLGHARSQQFRNGYFDQSAEMWGPGGELLAVTHQIVYFRH